MKQIFFPRLTLFYFTLFLYPTYNSYIEELLATSLHAENQKNNAKNVYSVYGHHKFCKKISFYYHAEIKDTNKTNQLILSLLLIHNHENEQEIIKNNEILVNTLQWHCHIENNKKIIHPENITKKIVNQHDIILFGEKHIPFGTLHTITFNIDNYKDTEKLLFNINQYNKEFLICLSF